ncbi:MAG: LCP family protein [Lachnospiraceae bacterium]|nr:LCP family protein [Lachnospiraceae bacterium]
MWKKVMMGILIVLSAFVGFFVAKAQVMFNNSLNQVNRDYDTALANVDLSGIDVNSDDQVVNILIIGNDYREERNYTAGGLTDTMIIATMDMKHNTLKLVSLMRDLVVEIPGYGKNKLNSANSYGGVELLYKTIATNFNIELDGYVEVGFTAFTKIIDKVDGVEVELTESEASYLNRTNYIRDKKSRNVKVGKQTLNGAQALGYCRIRKGGVTTVNGLRDDYGRTWRQRTVINAIFNKVKKLPKSEWMDIANTLLKHITTDLTNEQITEYLKDTISMGTTTVHQLQIPVQGYFRSGQNGEFSCGSCIVMTSGGSSWDTSANAEALNQFVFDYDGKQEFQYTMGGSSYYSGSSE